MNYISCFSDILHLRFTKSIKSDNESSGLILIIKKTVNMSLEDLISIEFTGLYLEYKECKH